MPHLDAMAVFARVVEAQSFSAAARVLGLSKAAVSKQVGGLESRLGARLLNRTTRSLSLTEAGRSFYEGCQRMLAEAEAAELAVSDLAAGPHGALRISAPMSFGQRHLMPILSEFLTLYPEISIELELADRRVHLVEEGFDLALRVGELADSSLIARRLARSRGLVIAAPAYLAREGRPQRPSDLRAHDCLVYSYAQRPDVWQFHGPSGKRRVKVAGRLQANNGEALLEAACAGLGVAVLPSFICAQALRDGRLERLLPDWRSYADSSVYLVYPAARHLLLKHRVFIDYLAGQFADPPPWDRGLDL